MANELKQAIDKAIQHIEILTSKDAVAELRKQYSKMTKEQLIDALLEHTKPKKASYTIESIVYAILCDPDCAWLTWEVIAQLIQTHVPNANTSTKALQWYSSKGIEKDKQVVPRKRAKDYALLLAKEVGNL